jgi:hypothetical protein
VSVRKTAPFEFEIFFHQQQQQQQCSSTGFFSSAQWIFFFLTFNVQLDTMRFVCVLFSLIALASADDCIISTRTAEVNDIAAAKNLVTNMTLDTPVGAKIVLTYEGEPSEFKIKVVMTGYTPAAAFTLSESGDVTLKINVTGTVGSTTAPASSAARMRSFLPSLVSAAASCLFAPRAAKAATVCPLEVVIKVNESRFVMTRLLGPGAAAAICRSGSKDSPVREGRCQL